MKNERVVAEGEKIATENTPVSKLSNDWKNTDGTIKWPPNNGAVKGTEEVVTLKKGDILGRIGNDGGKYTSPAGTDPDKLSLAPGTNVSVHTEYRIIRDIPDVEKVEAWFDKHGGGTQYKTNKTLRELIQKGYIVPK